MPKPNAVFKSVQHPGTKKQPFLRPGVKFGFELLKQLIPKALASIDGKVTEKKVNTVLNKAVRTAAFAAQSKARDLCPKDKGVLKDSIGIEKQSELLYTVGTNIKYGIMVEEGTKPHKIRPKVKQALAFFWAKLAASRKAYKSALKENRARSAAAKG